MTQAKKGLGAEIGAEGSGDASRVAKHRRAALAVGAAIVALEILDVLTTLKVIATGGAEVNPVMSTLMTVLGPAWWLPKVILASCVAGYFATRRRVGWPSVVALVLCALVALNNIAHLLA
jgi:uncharacterized protein DUF5658